MHIFCLDYTVSVSKSYPLRVQNKLTTSHSMCLLFVKKQGGPVIRPPLFYLLVINYGKNSNGSVGVPLTRSS